MTREIIFRGKKTQDGEWIYGSSEERESMCSIVGYVSTPPTTQDPGGDTVFMYDVVDPNTVGQFTGQTFKETKLLTLNSPSP